MSPEQNKNKLTLTDGEYFSSYEDLEIHRLMIGDKPRTNAYQQAIRDNPHLFKGKTVMDVGAGTGILSLFAAAAGAKRVYAVEASSTAALVEQVAADNNLSAVITVLHKRVEDIQLSPGETVDVIISEWMGFYLVHESMLNSVLVARDRFLSDEGTIFPSEARMYASPCSLQSLYDKQLNFWDNVHGFNMSAIGSAVLEGKGKKPEVCIVKPEDLLSKPACFKIFNLRYIDSEDLTSFSESTFVDITKLGTYQGICVWFECDFDGRDYDEEGNEFGKLVTLSTSPFSEPTHWKQTVVAFGKAGTGTKACESNNITHETENSNSAKKLKTNDISTKITNSCSNTTEFIELEEDEVIGWKLAFVQSEDNARHYTISLQMLDAETDEHPESCACSMPRCLIIAKLLEKELEGQVMPDDETILAK